MDIEGLIRWIVVGVVAGFLASVVMRRRGSLLTNSLIGMLGAIVGEVVFSFFDLGGATDVLGSILIASVGAVLILAVVK